MLWAEAVKNQDIRFDYVKGTTGYVKTKPAALNHAGQRDNNERAAAINSNNQDVISAQDVAVSGEPLQLVNPTRSHRKCPSFLN